MKLSDRVMSVALKAVQVVLLIFAGLAAYAVHNAEQCGHAQVCVMLQAVCALLAVGIIQQSRYHARK